MFNTERQNNTTDDIVPIYDENDPLEVAAKTKLNAPTYYKSMNEIYRIVGLEEFGISLAGGKQKKKADKILAQYVVFHKEKGRVYVEGFWKVPQYIPSENNRGKRGFYVDRVPLMLLRYLTLYARRRSVGMKEEFHYSATVNDLAIGLKNRQIRFQMVAKR